MKKFKFNLVTRLLSVSIFNVIALMLAPLLLSGCASITSSSMQNVSIETQNKKNEPLSGVRCNASNDKGTWDVKTPEAISIQKSAADLIVYCEKNGHEPGTTRAVSKAGAGMWGNIIIGGGIGALIDHNKGTAYNYPSVITVTMGESNTVPQP